MNTLRDQIHLVAQCAREKTPIKICKANGRRIFHLNHYMYSTSTSNVKIADLNRLLFRARSLNLLEELQTDLNEIRNFRQVVLYNRQFKGSLGRIKYLSKKIEDCEIFHYELQRNIQRKFVKGSNEEFRNTLIDLRQQLQAGIISKCFRKTKENPWVIRTKLQIDICLTVNSSTLTKLSECSPSEEFRQKVERIVLAKLLVETTPIVPFICRDIRVILKKDALWPRQKLNQNELFLVLDHNLVTFDDHIPFPEELDVIIEFQKIYPVGGYRLIQKGLRNLSKFKVTRDNWEGFIEIIKGYLKHSYFSEIETILIDQYPKIESLFNTAHFIETCLILLNKIPDFDEYGPLLAGIENLYDKATNSTEKVACLKLLTQTNGDFEKTVNKIFEGFGSLKISELDSASCELLDLIGTDSRFQRIKSVVQFHYYVWPTKKREAIAPGVPLDFTIKLRGGLEVKAHTAILARGRKNSFSVFRDPLMNQSVPRELNLTQFTPIDVACLLSVVYGEDELNLDQNLVRHLYGPNGLDEISPPSGKDPISDIVLQCDDGEIHAHRVILYRRLGTYDLKWNLMTTAEAQVLLNFIYAEKFFLDEIEELLRIVDKMRLRTLKSFILQKLREAAEWKPHISSLEITLEFIKIFDRLGFFELSVIAKNTLNNAIQSWKEFVQKDHYDIQSWLNYIQIYRTLDGNYGFVLDKENIRKAHERLVTLMIEEKNEIFTANEEVIICYQTELSNNKWNLINCLINNPMLRLDLSRTDIDENFIATLVLNRFPVGRLVLEGCRNLSPAVVQLAQMKVPTTITKVTSLMIRLANLGTIEMQISLASYMILNGHFDLSEFSINDFLADLLLEEFKKVEPNKYPVILKSEKSLAQATTKLSYKLLKLGFKVELAFPPDPRRR